MQKRDKEISELSSRIAREALKNQRPPTSTDEEGCLVRTMLFIWRLSAGLFIRSFVFMTMWNWFMIRIFEARSISIVQSLAMTILLAHILARRSGLNKERDTSDMITEELAYTVVFPLMALGIGWVVLQWM